MAMYGFELAEMRKAAALSLRDLAERMGYSHVHVSMVERGLRTATAAFSEAYITAVKGGTIADMDRRKFLTVTGAAAMAVPTFGDPGLPRTITATDVAELRRLAHSLNFHHIFGLRTAQSTLESAWRTLSTATMAREVRVGLMAACGLLAERIGWALHERGDRNGAMAMLRQASRLAHGGEDFDLASQALINLAIATPNPLDGLSTLDHALALPDLSGAQTINTLSVATRIAGPIDTRRALGYLSKASDTPPSYSEADWSRARGASSPGHLNAVLGFGGHAIGHVDAPTVLSAALTELPDDRRSLRARVHVRLCHLALLAGDDAAVVTHLRHVIAAPQTTTVAGDHMRVVARIRKGGRDDLLRLALQPV
jgi:hypothetical protein